MNTKLTLVSKPYYDIFTFRLFQHLLDTIDVDYSAYYIWSNPADKLQHFLKDTNFGTTKNVVIGIKDGLDMWIDFNHWHDNSGKVMQHLDAMAHRWPDSNFIIITSVENFALERYTAKNLQFMSHGGDWLNQHNQYKKIIPVLDKNFSSDASFITLNRQLRSHRVVMLSYLFGQGINKFGYISFLNNHVNNVDKLDFLDIIDWEFDEPRHSNLRGIILTGFKKFFANPDAHELIQDSIDIYEHSHICDNITNFENSLRNKYTNSFVEIVSESSFTTPGFFITEKTAHCFYGCNFPIILGGPGIVRHLKEIGFDMFDDIIDHSYDLIANPFDRIAAAIDNNIGILTDVELVKQLWKKNKQRFVNNVNTINNIDTYYMHRALVDWKKIKWI